MLIIEPLMAKPIKKAKAQLTQSILLEEKVPSCREVDEVTDAQHPTETSRKILELHILW